ERGRFMYAAVVVRPEKLQQDHHSNSGLHSQFVVFNYRCQFTTDSLSACDHRL
ncbi:hypothetical protein L9F63_006167, partial [Diploptera punctata]